MTERWVVPYLGAAAKKALGRRWEGASSGAGKETGDGCMLISNVGGRIGPKTVKATKWLWSMRMTSEALDEGIGQC